MSESQPVKRANPSRITVVSVARAISSIYGIAIFLFALQVGWIAIGWHYTVPNFDDWRIFDDLFSTPLLQWIFEDQNGHRVPVTLSLLFIDYEFFGGHMNLLALASVLCVGVSIAVLVNALRFESLARDPIARSAVGFACFLLCWAAARHDLVWGMNQGTLMGAMWTLLCMASLGVVVRRELAGDSARRGPLLAAAGAALAATFSQGAGFSCWVGLLTVGVLIRLPVRTLLAYGILAAVVLAVYMTGVEIPLYDTPRLYLGLLWRVPGRLFEYTLAFVGAPAAALINSQTAIDARAFSVVAGATGIAGYIALLLMLLIRRPSMTPLHVFAIGLPPTALAGGLMVALNRSFWPGTAIDLRFTTWSTLFWIGLVFALPALRQATTTRRGWPALGVTGLFILLSFLLLTDLSMARAGHAAHNSRLEYVSTMHLLGIRWDQLAGTTIIPMPERAYRVVEHMRRDRRSFFDAPRAAWAGTPVSESFNLVEDERCAGAVSWTERVRTRDGPAVLLAGWAHELDGHRPLEQIVIADRKGIVRGLGLFVAPDADLGKAQLPARQFPWAGFVGRPSAGAPYRTYGVLDDGASVCELNRVNDSSKH